MCKDAYGVVKSLRVEHPQTRSCERVWQTENTDCTTGAPSAHPHADRWLCWCQVLFLCQHSPPSSFPLQSILTSLLLSTSRWKTTPGPNQSIIKSHKMCIFSQWETTVGFEPLTRGQVHQHRETKAHVEHINFTDGRMGGAGAAFQQLPLHSSYLLAYDITRKARTPAYCKCRDALFTRWNVTPPSCNTTNWVMEQWVTDSTSGNDFINLS